MVHASWDHHSNLDEELGYNAGMADQPLAALIADLKARFARYHVVSICRRVRPHAAGRKPGRSIAREGWARSSPICFQHLDGRRRNQTGASLRKADEIGWNVTENPVHMNDFHATILAFFSFSTTCGSLKTTKASAFASPIKAARCVKSCWHSERSLQNRQNYSGPVSSATDWPPMLVEPVA